MANCFKNYLNIINKVFPTFSPQVRSGHWMRGKPPGVARTLEQRLAELNYKDPELHFRVDIGLPLKTKTKPLTVQDRIDFMKERRKDPNLEKIARNRELLLDLDEVRDEHLNTIGPSHIQLIADHYGVNQHLFGDAYFFPVVPLNVVYVAEELELPVCFGNVIKSSQATKKPSVCFNADKDSLWTLILTNPDGHFTEQDSEYVHWFVGNIPGNNIDKGEVVIDYLQPFPPKGTGYHRFIFVLYKQEKKMDFSELKKNSPCLNLCERTFKTLEFYRARQDFITPAGLAFFQSDWDRSLTDFYHETLNMKEPVFEYDFPQPYLPKEKWFAKRHPFNLYLDRYRDPKQINKEFLLRKLKKVHPFKAPATPLPYPNAQYFETYVPSWLKNEIRKSRLKWGRINEID